MREYMFGVSRQKPTRKAVKQTAQIAKRHGAYLVEATLPGTGYQRWFVGPGLGNPFDIRMSTAVHAELVQAGILIAQVARILNGAPLTIVQACWAGPEGDHHEYRVSVGTSPAYERWVATYKAGEDGPEGIAP